MLHGGVGWDTPTYPKHVSKPTPPVQAISQRQHFFSLDRKAAANYIKLRHILHHPCISSYRNAPCHCRSSPNQNTKTGIYFRCQKVLFGDILLTQRASIMCASPVMEEVTCCLKTSSVSPSGNSFGTERHCPNQNLSQPTPVSPT